jgi:hypothetical protein
MMKPTRSLERRRSRRGLLWNPQQIASGLLLTGAVIVGGSLVSCSTAEKVGQSEPESVAVTTGPSLVAPTASVESSLDQCVRLVSAADELLDQTPAVQAVFHKRERLGGRLEEQNVMLLKVRREPMSVYMRWHAPDAGREALWQENANEGQILVHPGGWKRKFVPMIKVDPYGARAAEGGRRPINTSGPWHFCGRLLDLLREQQAAGTPVHVTEDAVALHGIPCRRFTLVRAAGNTPGEFHKANIYIEQDRLIPIGFELYSTPLEGVPVLEESYAFQNLELDAPLADIDFSSQNPKYEYGARSTTTRR